MADVCPVRNNNGDGLVGKPYYIATSEELNYIGSLSAKSLDRNGSLTEAPRLRYEVKASRPKYWAGDGVWFKVQLSNEDDEPFMVYWSDLAYDDQYRFGITRQDGKEVVGLGNRLIPPLEGLEYKYFKNIPPGGHLEYSIHLGLGVGRNGQKYSFREPGEYVAQASFLAIVVSPQDPNTKSQAQFKEKWRGILKAKPVKFTIENSEENPFAEQFGSITISGKVVDTEVRPVTGANILMRLKRMSDQPGGDFYTVDVDMEVTDEQGRFTFTNLPDDSPVFILRGWHRCYHGPKEVIVANELPKKSYETTVVTKKGFTLKGSVVDTQGNPVAGARISSYTEYPFRRETYTDTKGRFELEGIIAKRDDTVRCEAWKRGYVSKDCGASKGQAQSGDWRIVLKHKDEQAFSGRAIFADGTSAANMKIFFQLSDNKGHRGWAEETRTDEQGRFKAVLSRPGRFLGTALIEEEAKDYFVPHGRWLTKVEGIEPWRDDLELVFENRGSIKASIEPSNELSALREFEITCIMLGPTDRGPEGTIASTKVSSKGGTVFFKNLSPAKYRIEVKDKKAGRWNWRKEVTLSRSGEKMKAQVSFVLPEMYFGKIKAKVLKPEGKKPVLEGSFWLNSSASWGWMKINEGSIEVNQVPVGPVWLEIRVKGFANSRVSGLVNAGQTADLGSIILVPEAEATGWVEGHILYEDGSPAIGAALVTKSFVKIPVEADGGFRTKLSVGKTVLVVELASAPGWPRFSLPASRETHIDWPWNLARECDDKIYVPVDIKPGLTIKKDIIINRAAIGNIDIKWLGNSDDRPYLKLLVASDEQFFACHSPYGTTGQRGQSAAFHTSIQIKESSFRIEDVPTGKRILILRAGDYCGYKVAANGEKDTIFTFDAAVAGTISGKLVLDDGSAACNATVRLYIEPLIENDYLRNISGNDMVALGGIISGTRTDENGSFSFAKVEPGPYVIKTQPSGSCDVETVEVKPRSEIEVTVLTKLPPSEIPPLRQAER